MIVGGMQVRSSANHFQTPDRLDRWFGVVAGLYVATLVSPAILLLVVERLQLRSVPLVLGLLGVVGMTCSVLVSRQVTRRGGLVEWFNAPWMLVIVPATGVVPMVGYFVLVIRYIAFSVTELQADTAAGLVGVTGFVLGIVAGCLGGALVLMARTRLIDTTLQGGDVSVEWTAGWPTRARVAFGLGMIGASIPLLGSLYWALGIWATNAVLALGMLLVIGLYSVVAARTYRVTSAGLEQQWDGSPLDARRLTSWSQFEGFSLTDDAIVLHRPVPYVDVRCSRRDLVTDEAVVVAALDAHLDRRDA